MTPRSLNPTHSIQMSPLTGAGVKLPEPEEREGESGTAGADQQIEVDRLDCIF